VNRSRSTAAALSSALAVAVCLTLAGPAFGFADHRVVKVTDDCHQATFDAAIGPGTCVGDGRTTFPEFLAEFQDQGSVDRWAFSRPHFGLDAGGRIDVVNEGGEFHSFTEVPRFGNGCVPPLNADDGPPVVDCSVLETTGVPAGATLPVANLEPGTHLFQCMIHPWMRSTVEVRED
jgi:hypothetical protein